MDSVEKVLKVTEADSIVMSGLKTIVQMVAKAQFYSANGRLLF
jgi:hypothetical protein